jgi:hypothetical protein
VRKFLDVNIDICIGCRLAEEVAGEWLCRARAQAENE